MTNQQALKIVQTERSILNGERLSGKPNAYLIGDKIQWSDIRRLAELAGRFRMRLVIRVSGFGGGCYTLRFEEDKG